MMTMIALLALTLASGACRGKPAARPGAEEAAYAPPTGKRAFSLAIDKSQTQFLRPGDAAEVLILLTTPRADGTSESRSEVLSPRAEVLRVRGDWSDDNGLVQLALSPEETQYAALAVDREDRLFLNKLPEAATLAARRTPAKPVLEPGRRGLSILVHADQQEFLGPGDRVDVVAARQGSRAAGKSELAALTLLQDALVLGAGPPTGNDDWATVQLMLTPSQVEAMARAVAGEDSLTLAGRAPGDRSTRPVEPSRMSRRFGTDAERRSPKS